jgi:tryptophan-rich sensory protein
MQKKRRNSGMLIPTIIMGILAIVLLLIGYFRGQELHSKKNQKPEFNVFSSFFFWQIWALIFGWELPG